MRERRFGRGDLVLIVALLLAGLLLMLPLRLHRSAGSVAIVRVDGEEVARLPMNEDAEFPVEIDGVVTNVVAVGDGAVRVIDANCPDQLCVRKGVARYAGDGIVCLPNRVVVEVAGTDELDLDAVTG